METILDYRLEGLLGKGSFSEVYKASRQGKLFAIKLMRPPTEINAEGLVNSLRYEFWVLKDLNHPNIVRLFDFGGLKDGRIYLVEEPLEGAPLDQFCRDRPFRECETVFVGILEGLAELARWRLVHGDIKPANILVVGSMPPVGKILDFGLARASSLVPRQSPIFQGGTPSTMAPEIILKQPSDQRADLYSLGVSIYTALTGKNPFVEKTVDQTLKAHLHKQPDPIGLTRRDVPPEWGDLIERLLQKNPADRPASALKALSLVKKEKFILTPTPFVGRKKFLEEAMKIEKSLEEGQKVALVVRGPAGVGVGRFLREVFYRLVRHHPDLRNRLELVEAPPLPDVPVLLLNRIDPPQPGRIIRIDLPPFSRQETKEWLLLALGVSILPDSFLEKMFELTRGHPASIWKILSWLAEKNVLADATGRVTFSTLSLVDWKKIVSREETPEGIAGNFDWVVGEVRHRIRDRKMPGDDPLWPTLESLAEKEKSPSLRLQKRALLLALKGEGAIDEGKLDEAHAWLSSALEIFKNDPAFAVEKVRTKNFLAYILLRQGKTAGAVGAFEENLREIQLWPLTRKRLVANLDLGVAYLEAGEYPKAVKRLVEELAFHRVQLKEPELAEAAQAHEISCLYNLARAHAASSQFREAEEYFRDVLRKAREGVDPAFILRAQNGLGNVLQQTERWPEALSAYAEAMEVALAIKDYPSAAAACQNRGVLAGEHGLYDEALSTLEDSLRYARQIPVHYAYEKNLVCRSHLEMGEIFAKLNQGDRARDCLDRAWHLAEKDDDLASFRFWILIARCKAWQALREESLFKKDLALLNFYADDPQKREKMALLSSARTPPQADLTRKEEVVPREEGGTPIRELDRLLRINQDLVGEMPLEELLRRILGHAIELTGAELGVVLLEERGDLTPSLSLNAKLDDDLSSISLSVAREVLATGNPVLADDALHDENFNQNASVMALALRSILALPIFFRGKILGVLYLSHRFRPGVFTEDKVLVLKAFANQAGLALTNHSLLEFHRKAKEGLELELEDAQVSLTAAREKILNLPEGWREKVMEGPLKTKSPAMLEILREVERVASSNVGLVIHGETGTGKELLARYAHQASSRREKPFVAINCGALPSTLLESELFGHRKGAFTGADRDKVGLIEAADGGTLFLDEVTELSPEAQVKLLRVLQEREVLRVGDTKPRPVDIRVMAASPKPLGVARQAQKFRDDLFYRLVGYEVTLPPLRERPDDILLLTHHFLSEASRDLQKRGPQKIDPSLMRLFLRYSWPGNVRELKSLVLTAATLCEEKTLGLGSLPEYLRERLKGSRFVSKGIGQGEALGWFHPGKSWKEHELMIYAAALVAFDFDVPRVARSLKVGIATVYKWLRENRLRETREEWKKMSPSYPEGLSLQKIRATVFALAAKRHPGHPYRAARELGVAPVTFYRWSREHH